MDDAVALLQSWGLRVVLGETLNATFHQFAGDDELRTIDLQRFIDDNEVKAIFAARGGYGTLRIIDGLAINNLATNPKWIVGFSDITVLHAHVWAGLQLQTIHGQMPVNIPDASAKSLQSLRKALFGEEVRYQFSTENTNRMGSTTAQVIGGNLSMLIAILCSPSDIDYSGKILFLEDVGEYLYAVDRMLYVLKRAGKLNNLAGLIIGGFTDLKENEIPFGFSVADMVMNVVKEHHYPVCFDFPAGHLADNNALILGRIANLHVELNSAELTFIQ